MCPEHGIFYQTRRHHLVTEHGCPLCGNKQVIDQATFLSKVASVHGDKYDYSAVQYSGTDIPVTIYCKSCETDFEQKPHYHIAGSNCPTCAGRSYKYLYILRSGNLTKVGISNKPKQRISSLKHSLGRDWSTSNIFEFSNAREAEKYIHYMYASYNYRGLTGDGYTEVFKMDANTHKSISEVAAHIGGILAKEVSV